MVCCNALFYFVFFFLLLLLLLVVSSYAVLPSTLDHGACNLPRSMVLYLTGHNFSYCFLLCGWSLVQYSSTRIYLTYLHIARCTINLNNLQVENMCRECSKNANVHIYCFCIANSPCLRQSVRARCESASYPRTGYPDDLSTHISKKSGGSTGNNCLLTLVLCCCCCRCSPRTINAQTKQTLKMASTNRFLFSQKKKKNKKLRNESKINIKPA